MNEAKRIVGVKEAYVAIKVTGEQGKTLAERLKKAKEGKEAVRPVEEQVVRAWNGVVEALEVAKENWEQMQELLALTSRDEIDLMPLEVQKATKRFRRAKFTVMLERFVEHYRAYGGLERMKVKGKGGAKNEIR